MQKARFGSGATIVPSCASGSRNAVFHRAQYAPWSAGEPGLFSSSASRRASHRWPPPLKVQRFLPLHPYLRGYSAQSLRHREWRTLQSRIRKKSAETAPEPPQEEGFTPADEVEKKSIPALLRVLQEYPSSRFSNPSKSIFHGINDARNCTVKGAGQQIRAHTLI